MAADQGHDRRGGQAGGGHRRARRGAHVAAQGGRRGSPAAARSTRSGRRASRSTRSTGSTTASAAARAATRSRSSRRRRASTSSARSSGSPTASTSRSSTRTRRPEDDARRRRRDRLYALLDQAAAFYERYLWDSQAGSLARDYLAGRGLGEAICREFRLGLALGGNTLVAQGGARRGSARDELRAAGPRAPARRRLLPAAARVPARRCARARASASRHGGCTRTIRCARSTSTRRSRSSSTRARCSTGSTSRAPRSRSGDRACVVEGNTDVIALRQAGFEPVVASMGTALTEQQLRELARLSKNLWLAFDGDAAGESATLRGMELAVAQGFDVQRRRRCRRGSTPPTTLAAFQAQLRKRTAVRRAPHAARGDARGGSARGRASRRGVPRFAAGVAGEGRGVALGQRLLRHDPAAARLGRRHGERGRGDLAEDTRGQRAPRAGRPRRASSRTRS